MPKIDCFKAVLKQFPGIDPDVVQDFMNQAMENKGAVTDSQWRELIGEQLDEFTKKELLFKKNLVNDFIHHQKNMDLLTQKSFLPDVRKGVEATFFGEGLEPGSQNSLAAIKNVTLQKWHQMYEQEIYNKGLHNLLVTPLYEEILAAKFSDAPLVGLSPKLQNAIDTSAGSVVGLGKHVDKVDAQMVKTTYDIRKMMADSEFKQKPLGGNNQKLNTYKDQIDHIANVSSQIMEDGRQLKNDFGAFVDKYDGYAGKTVHKSEKLINAISELSDANIKVPEHISNLPATNKDQVFEKNFKAWRNFLEPKLDLNETYKRTGTKNQAEHDEYWLTAYKDITYGKVGQIIRNDAEDSIVPQGKMLYNLITKVSRKKIFIFKDGDSYAQYAAVFGNKYFIDDLTDSMETGSKDVAFLKKFGSNPDEAFKKLIIEMKNKYTDMQFSEDPKVKAMGEKGLKRLESGQDSMNRKFNYLKGNGGGAETDAEGQVAKAAAFWRAAQITRHLGSSIIRQFDDTTSATHLLSTMTGQRLIDLSTKSVKFMYAKELVKGIAGIRGLSTNKYVNDSVLASKMGMDYVLSERIGGYDAADLAPGVMSKLNSNFMKFNGMNMFGQITKNATSMVLSHILTSELEKPFENLHPNFQKTLLSHDINAEDWKVMGKAVNDVLVGDEFPGKSIKMFSIANMERSPLVLNIMNLYNDLMESGTNMAGAKQHWKMYGDHPLNTKLAQVRRFFFQFQGPTFRIIENQRRIGQYASGFTGPEAGGVKDFNNYRRPLFIAELIGMSAASVYLGSVLKHKIFDPKDKATQIQIASGSGLLAIPIDDLLQELSRGNKMDPGAATKDAMNLLGPTGGDVAIGAALAAEKLGFNKVSASKKANFYNSLIPGNNLWWFRAIQQNGFADAIGQSIDPKYKEKQMVHELRQKNKRL